jgi:hypothetical protein
MLPRRKRSRRPERADSPSLRTAGMRNADDGHALLRARAAAPHSQRPHARATGASSTGDSDRLDGRRGGRRPDPIAASTLAAPAPRTPPCPQASPGERTLAHCNDHRIRVEPFTGSNVTSPVEVPPVHVDTSAIRPGLSNSVNSVVIGMTLQRPIISCRKDVPTPIGPSVTFFATRMCALYRGSDGGLRRWHAGRFFGAIGRER